MLLALDTATGTASVALFDGESVLGEVTWRGERRAGDELFPQLERLLALAGVSLGQVDRVAVATGPGSFTGIRVGIAAARGLARASGAAVAGVSTLDVLAYPHASSGVRVCPLLPAGRDEWYAAFYEERGGAWERRSPYLAGTLADIAGHDHTRTLFVGEYADDDALALRDLLGAKAAFATPARRVRRAGYLAELGWAALERGVAAGRDLEPVYVKSASIGGGGRIRRPEPVAAPRAE